MRRPSQVLHHTVSLDYSSMSILGSVRKTCTGLERTLSNGLCCVQQETFLLGSFCRSVSFGWRAGVTSAYQASSSRTAAKPLAW